jgi:thiamine biosynthesis protein ThiS
MDITVNGQEKRVSAPITVLDLLASLAIEPRKVAVERNLEIVPKSAYDAVTLAAGDRIEIVQFVGGG